MPHANEPDHLTQSISPAEPFPVTTQPAPLSRDVHTTAIIDVIALLAVVFGTGLFAVWASSTRRAGSTSSSASPATTALLIPGKTSRWVTSRSKKET